MKEELDIETKREQDGLDFDHKHEFYRNRLRQDERAAHEARVSKLMVVPDVALKKAANEDLYTENVEELLENLKGPLTVTHTVALVEVKKHLAKWIPSLEKEIGNLEGNGTLKRIPLAKAKELQDKGELVIVPGKTVHTVKPPDPVKANEVSNEEEATPAWFKRKSRMVICGNFIKNEVEVYAAAANAESVRCALSVAAKKRWLAAISDINQAFTLTPISEADTRYAVLAPKVLAEAGCVPPGTAYLAERLLYGLREAPRLWGGFRDKRFRNAKIKIGDGVFRLIQLETDAAVWKLVRDDPLKTLEEFATVEALALVIVYVDDVMFLGDEEMILALYAWVTEGAEGEQCGWKCSALEFVREKPVRYLGMELRCKVRASSRSSMPVKEDTLRTFFENTKLKKEQYRKSPRQEKLCRWSLMMKKGQSASLPRTSQLDWPKRRQESYYGSAQGRDQISRLLCVMCVAWQRGGQRLRSSLPS